MNRLLLFAIAVLPLVLVGCSSAQRQYERGMELEARGDFAGAAHYYAQAIRRDRDLNRMLPGRLRESGRQAVEAFVADARSLELAARSIDAADRYRDADAILRLGPPAGVDIPMPHRYMENRRAAFDRAVEALLEHGRGDHELGDFQASLRRYERAERYEPGRDQVDELRNEAAATRLSWSASLLDAGQYRRAYDVAEAGLRFPTPFAPRFHELQLHAIEGGTVLLATLPLQRLGGELADLPGHFTQDLALLLDDEYWSRPPLFVETTDPRDVRAVTRRHLGRDILVGNARLTASLGRELHADFALATGAERFVRTTGEERRTERTARLRRRGAGNATYIEIRTPTTFRAEVRFEVVEVATRRVVCGDRVERAATGHVLTAEYDGDPRELNLTREQEALFTASGIDDQERRLHDRLAHELADALSTRVYACVSARVP